MQDPRRNVPFFGSVAVLIGVPRGLAVRIGAIPIHEAPSGTGLLVKDRGGDFLAWPLVEDAG